MTERDRTTTGEWQQLDRAHYLHPFTDFKALAARGARIVTRAEGVYIYTSDGDKILDGMSGLWCVALGYGRKELAGRGLQADAGAALLQQLLPEHAPRRRSNLREFSRK